MKHEVNTIIELVDEGWDIKVYNELKRIDGAFIIKTCWEAKKDDISKKSRWKGFDTAQDAVDNLIEKLTE